MSKKNFIILILVLLAIIGGLSWYFFFRGSTTTGTGSTGTDGTDLFPFGQGGTSTNGGQTATSTDNGGQIIDISSGAIVPRLRELWKDQAAGGGFLASGSTTFAFRFVDRATGHIYESPSDSLGTTKISNVTVPQVYDALWASNGREAIMRYLKDDTSIQSLYVTVSTSTAATSTPIEGYFLPTGIRDIALAGRKIIYLNPSVGTGNIIEADIDGARKASIFNSDLGEWSLSWSGGRNAFISSRPTGTVAGFGYVLDTSTGATTKVLDTLPGLTGTINPSGTWIFASDNEKRQLASASYDIKNAQTDVISIKTLSDKCAWSNTRASVIYCAVPVSIPSGTYPDDWYQGVTSFNDRLWQIDLATGETNLVFDPRFDAQIDMDMFKLSVDAKDSYLLFTNKKDMSLWVYRLN